MGFPSPAEDHSDKELNLHEYLVVRPAATFFWRYNGSEMERAGIKTGALLVVDRSLIPRDGDVVVARHMGQWVVRMLYKNQLGNAPLDEDVSILFATEETQIWGVVTHVVNTLRPGSTRSDRYGDVSDGIG